MGPALLMQGSYFIQCHPAGEFGLKYLIEGKNVFAAQVLYNDPYIAEKQTDERAALLDLHCSCCPETPKDARSDCHAWSALPLYVLPKTDISEPAPEMEKK